LHSSCKHLCNDILLMHKTYRPSMFSVKRKYENIQIKPKLLAKVGLFKIILRKNEHVNLLF